VSEGAATILAERRPHEGPVRAPVRPLRVAQVVTKLTAGAGGVALRGALSLDRDRFDTTIFAAEGGSLIPRAKDAGVDVVSLRYMAPGRRVYPWIDLQGVREVTSHLAAGGFDLVHTHSAKAGGLGRLAARRVGVGTVVHTFHGFPFHQFQSPLRRRALVETERRLGRITDYFVGIGAAVAAEAVRLRIAPPDRIRAMAPPIDSVPPVSDPARRRARGLLGIPLEAKVIGTVARLDSQKSPEDLVRAVAALRRVDVWLAWVGDGDLRARTERLAAKLGLGDRCLLLGDRADVAALLPGFDVFAMPSLYEGLPCAVVEAMTCGVPVAATAVNSVPEIVVAGKTGLLARPGDPDSLARALAYLLDHPDEATRMADAARAQVGGRFQPEGLGQELAEVYEIALRLGRGSS
jgi:glycosyltransferase involved in cell wall biosynthesis